MSLRPFPSARYAQGCEFCLRLQPDAPPNRAWYDFRIILETRDFVVVPALGSIVPGYLMLVTKRHVPSMAHLDTDELLALGHVSGQIAALQTELWAPPVIFEHGACDEESDRAGSCIVHAHWHMVPGNWMIRPPELSFEAIDSFEGFATPHSKQNGYFYVKDEAGSFLAKSHRVQSQFLRKVLAKAAGQADAWDYALFPFLENIQQSLTKLNGRKITDPGQATQSPTINAYNAMAESYCAKTRNFDPGSGLQSVLDRFMENLQGRLALDAGAGSCRDSLYLSQNGLKVEMVDLAEKLLRASADLCPNNDKRVMDVRFLAYADNVFDGIWCSAVLLHLNTVEIQLALNEFWRVLKSNGVLHVSLKEGEGSQKVLVEQSASVYREFYYYDRSRLARLMEQAGFTVSEMVIVQEADSDGEVVAWLRCLAMKTPGAQSALGQ